MRLDYMGSSILMGRTSKLSVELKDEWKIQACRLDDSDPDMVATRRCVFFCVVAHNCVRSKFKPHSDEGVVRLDILYILVKFVSGSREVAHFDFAHKIHYTCEFLT